MQNPQTLLVVLIALVMSLVVTGGVLFGLARSGILSPMLSGILFVLELLVVGLVFVRVQRR